MSAPYTPILATLGYVLSPDRRRVLMIHRNRRPGDLHLGKYNGLGGKLQRDEEREGVYRSERSYGTFYREIPLPPGTMSDQAKANFQNGVLEVTMPAPPESARRGRRLDISEAVKR